MKPSRAIGLIMTVSFLASLALSPIDGGLPFFIGLMIGLLLAEVAAIFTEDSQR